MVYADSSALVKLVIEEPESAALERHLAGAPVLATSRLALVEVPRATALANPAPEVQGETQSLLASCMLIDVSDGVLRAAAGLSSGSVRTLDAIHLATADLWREVQGKDPVIATHDRALALAARASGFRVIGVQ